MTATVVSTTSIGLTRVCSIRGQGSRNDRRYVTPDPARRTRDAPHGARPGRVGEMADTVSVDILSVITENARMRVPADRSRWLVLAATIGMAITSAAAGWSGWPTVSQVSMALATAMLAGLTLVGESEKESCERNTPCRT
jgi:hypothetical protein